MNTSRAEALLTVRSKRGSSGVTLPSGSLISIGGSSAWLISAGTGFADFLDSCMVVSILSRTESRHSDGAAQAVNDMTKPTASQRGKYA